MSQKCEVCANKRTIVWRDGLIVTVHSPSGSVGKVVGRAIDHVTHPEQKKWVIVGGGPTTGGCP